MKQRLALLFIIVHFVHQTPSLLEHLTLSDFNLLVKKTLSNNLNPSYWIVAEIGEMNIAQKGHCYLDLVEKTDNTINARMRATIWSYAFATIQSQFVRMTGTSLQKGLKVLINASFEFHEIYGVSLNIKDIDPQFTLGEKERKKQETINQLESDGIIDLNKALVLPLVPQRIAIISSETAAGYGDFVDQILTNTYGYQPTLSLFHSVMQGDQAPNSVMECLHNIYAQEDAYDLVVIIRGGGAQTDLDCFDDYELCAHIAQFPLPVLSGIGHDRDSTIVDMVANVSLKTPTAVAEFVINGMMHFEQQILDLHQSIKQATLSRINTHHDALNHISLNLRMQAKHVLDRESYKLDNIHSVLTKKPIESIKRARLDVASLHKFIAANNPDYILKKGYTISKVNGVYLNDGSEVKKGDIIETITKNKTITSTVK